MSGHEWGENNLGYHMYGKMTNGKLKNTRGVKIYPGEVTIGHFKENGDVDTSRPNIHCNANLFTVR